MIIDLNWESVCVEDIFSDIIYTEENPLILKTESIYKEGDKVKRIKKEEKLTLYKGNLLQDLLDNGDKINTQFYQRGILRLFRKYNTKILKEIVMGLTDKNWMIMGTGVRKSLEISPTLLNGTLIIDGTLTDKCIIGNRNTRCILNKETREYYFDKDSITVFVLK